MDHILGYEAAVKLGKRLAARWNEPVNVCSEPGEKSKYALYTNAAMDRERIDIAAAICYPGGEVEEG